MRELTTHWRVGHLGYSACEFPLLPHRPSQVRFKALQPLAELGTCTLKKTEDSISLLDGKYIGLQHLVCIRHSSHLWGTNLLSNPSFSERLASTYHKEEHLPGYRIWGGSLPVSSLPFFMTRLNIFQSRYREKCDYAIFSLMMKYYTYLLKVQNIPIRYWAWTLWRTKLIFEKFLLHGR